MSLRHPVVAFSASAVLGIVALEIAFAAAALALRLVSDLGPLLAEALTFADPIYTRAAFETLRQAQPIGLSVGHRWPLQVALAPGSTALASALAASAANVLLVAVGLRVIGSARLALHALVATHLVLNPPTPLEIEATGLSFAVGVVAPTATGRSIAFTDLLATAPMFLQSAALVLVPLALVCGAASLLAWRRSRTLLGALGAAGLAAMALGALSPGPLEGPTLTALSPTASRATSIVRSSSDRLPPLFSRPSHVDIVRLPDFRFEYWVNGRREVIRGVGYNARYSALPREERLRRLDNDLERMAAAGVNTVLGWDMALFDADLLDAAQAHGLGVILPFDFNPQDNYANPAVREKLTREVDRWVRRHREHPALRMWGLGNEVLHKMVRPTWLGGMDDRPENVARARAFAGLVVDLADRIAEMDPRHPVTYREAEDAYLVWLREAMQDTHGMPENLVLGTNAFTSHLQKIVDGWPRLSMNAPLYISEFGAAGLAPGERPVAVRRMWEWIRSRPDWVLGGAVYVWTTDGPEEVDRAFGLVDARGEPIDGTLATVGEFYRADATQ